MINGDVNYFLDSLYVASDVEVLFRGRRYFIEGWCDWDEPERQDCHILMFEIGEDNVATGVIYEGLGGSHVDCAKAFLDVPVWEGFTFREAEPEIEWVA